jgi:hypothetical protein
MACAKCAKIFDDPDHAARRNALTSMRCGEAASIRRIAVNSPHFRSATRVAEFVSQPDPG